jgi:hypothetical protein
MIFAAEMVYILQVDPPKPQRAKNSSILILKKVRSLELKNKIFIMNVVPRGHGSLICIYLKFPFDKSSELRLAFTVRSFG